MGNAISNSSGSGGGGGSSKRLSRRTSSAESAVSGGSGGGGGGGSSTTKIKEETTKGMSRSASGTEITEKHYTQFVPIDKLAKILQQKSNEAYGINGIVVDVFVRNVFPKHEDLGERLYRFLHAASKAKTRHLGTVAFRQQCERFLGILDDTVILENYVKMYCDPDAGDMITPDGLKMLLTTCFELAMVHYEDGSHTHCPAMNKTLSAVTASVFFKKELLSSGFVCRWLEQNCPRLIPPIHRYCLHTLTTAYRGILDNSDVGLNLELATPVIDYPNLSFEARNKIPLMPLSQAWLLAGTLPPLYSKPKQVQSPTNNSSGNNLASVAFMAKMLSVVPSHWTLLYDSREDGLGANRFLHHVLGYKGPTLCMFYAEDGQVFCLAAPTEWRESHMFLGDKECCLIQVMPKFALIETGQKMIYLNTIHRGYAKGLQVGSDHRKPILSIDADFAKIDCHGISAGLNSIEVWGCGDEHSREVQMDIKKWQIKEAERQRTVKLTSADWLDNPDRYLLELNGRPQYNNSKK